MQPNPSEMEIGLSRMFATMWAVGAKASWWQYPKGGGHRRKLTANGLLMGENFKLGEVQFVQVEPTIWVANMIGQHDVKKGKDGSPPVRYEAIRRGLATVGYFARQHAASVHMPHIGCGLAGGTWDQIEPGITHELTGLGVMTVVYDFD